MRLSRLHHLLERLAVDPCNGEPPTGGRFLRHRGHEPVAGPIDFVKPAVFHRLVEPAVNAERRAKNMVKDSTPAAPGTSCRDLQSYFDPMPRQMFLRLSNRILAVVERTRRQHCIRPALHYAIDEMLQGPDAAARDNRNRKCVCERPSDT